MTDVVGRETGRVEGRVVWPPRLLARPLVVTRRTSNHHRLQSRWCVPLTPGARFNSRPLPVDRSSVGRDRIRRSVSLQAFSCDCTADLPLTPIYHSISQLQITHHNNP